MWASVIHAYHLAEYFCHCLRAKEVQITVVPLYYNKVCTVFNRYNNNNIKYADAVLKKCMSTNFLVMDLYLILGLCLGGKSFSSWLSMAWYTQAMPRILKFP